jgi:hypothetical protein
VKILSTDHILEQHSLFTGNYAGENILVSNVSSLIKYFDVLCIKLMLAHHREQLTARPSLDKNYSAMGVNNKK